MKRTPEEKARRHKERQLACEVVDKLWEETEFNEDDTRNKSEFAQHKKSWNGGYVHGWMEKYTRTSNLECHLAAVTAQRDELLGLLGKFFDAYENGTPCYEDPDDFDGYLGNAFVLGEEIFGRICEVLNQHEKSNDKIVGES